VDFPHHRGRSGDVSRRTHDVRDVNLRTHHGTTRVYRCLPRCP
jgi:hypothetical protein